MRARVVGQVLAKLVFGVEMRVRGGRDSRWKMRERDGRPCFFALSIWEWGNGWARKWLEHEGLGVGDRGKFSFGTLSWRGGGLLWRGGDARLCARGFLRWDGSGRASEGWARFCGGGFFEKMRSPCARWWRVLSLSRWSSSRYVVSNRAVRVGPWGGGISIFDF